jgi:hypothetical protein
MAGPIQKVSGFVKANSGREGKSTARGSAAASLG